MKLHLIDWLACELVSPVLRSRTKIDQRDLTQANEFCDALNAILEKAGYCDLVNQREHYDAISAIPMPPGFRHFRLVNSKNGLEIGHGFLADGWEPSAKCFHTTLGSQSFLVGRISNVRPGPFLEPGMFTLIADVEGWERENYSSKAMYSVEF